MRDPHGPWSLGDTQRPGSGGTRGGDTWGHVLPASLHRLSLGRFRIAPHLRTSHGQPELFGPFFHPKIDTEAAGKQSWTKGTLRAHKVPPPSPLPRLQCPPWLFSWQNSQGEEKKFPRFPAGNGDSVSLPMAMRWALTSIPTQTIPGFLGVSAHPCPKAFWLQ